MAIADSFPEAFEHYQNGEHALAASLCHRILDADSRHDKAMYTLGAIALDAGEFPQALEWLRHAIEVQPNIASYHTKFGAALRQMNRHPEATEALMTSLSMNPDDPEAYLNLALSLVAQDDTTALVALEHAADYNPNNYEIQLALARYLRSHGQDARSVGHYHCALNLQPNSADCLLELGVTLRSLGRLRSATHILRRATAAAPESAVALKELGATLTLDDNQDDAIRTLRKAIELDPHLAAAHANLGDALCSAGLVSQGIAAYRTALALKPDWTAVRGRIAFMMQYEPQVNQRDLLTEAQSWAPCARP